MQMRVTYTLSETGRREALRRGLPAQQMQTLTGEVDVSALDIPGVQVSNGGEPLLAPYIYSPDSPEQAGCHSLSERDAPFAGIDEALAAIQAAAAARLEELAARKRKELAEHEEHVTAALAAGAKHFIDDRYPRWTVATRGLIDERRCQCLIAQARHIVDVHTAELEAAEAAEDIQEKALEARKTQQLADAVAQLGSPLQRERWAAGVMPRREAIDLIVEQARRPLVDAGLVVEDSKHYHVDGDSQHEHSISTLNDLCWEIARKLPGLIPGVEIGYWRQEGTDSNTGETHTRIIARMTWLVGLVEVGADVVLDEGRSTPEEE